MRSMSILMMANAGEGAGAGAGADANWNATTRYYYTSFGDGQNDRLSEVVTMVAIAGMVEVDVGVVVVVIKP